MDVVAATFVALGVAGAVALVVLLIVVSVRRERERTERIVQWAASRGWTVTKRPTVEWTDQLPGRDQRGVSLLVTGKVNGHPVGVGNYSYTTLTSGGTGTNSTTHRYIVTAVWLATPYPQLAVLPRGALSQLGRFVFGDNVAAIGNDEFDRRFRVRTTDPTLSRALLGPALVGEHLAGRVPAWSLAGHDLVSWRSGRLDDPTQIGTLAAALVRVADLLGR